MVQCKAKNYRFGNRQVESVLPVMKAAIGLNLTTKILAGDLSVVHSLGSEVGFPEDTALQGIHNIP